MLAIVLLEMMATNVSSYRFRTWRRMLTIMFSDMLAIKFSRNVNNYNMPKSWKYDFQICWILYFSEMLATNVNNYNFQK